MSNKVLNPEKNLVDYSASIATAKVTNLATGETRIEKFKAFGSITAQIIHQDKYTIVLFEDGSKGISMCREGDTYSRKKGLKIAFKRALIVMLEKEIKDLLKD